MTKLEALAKDCIENHTHRLVDKPTKQDIYLREESIFIQGYRQSEKRIAELEMTVGTLRTFSNEQATCIERLEKENAELKETYRNYEQLIDKGSVTLAKERLENYKQLTKAKEIIREFVEWANWQGNSKCPSFKSIQDKAEQFLNGV